MSDFEPRMDKWRSSSSFSALGHDFRDAIVNKGRVGRIRRAEEKKAAKRMARHEKKMFRREAKRLRKENAELLKQINTQRIANGEKPYEHGRSRRFWARVVLLSILLTILFIWLIEPSA